MEYSLVQSFDVNASTDKFWQAVDIYTNRSHIINRRLIGEEICGNIALQNEQHLQDITNTILSSDNENIVNILEKEGLILHNESSHPGVVIVKRLLPKNIKLPHCVEVVVKDFTKNRVTFVNQKQNNHIAPNFVYAFSFDNEALNLWVENGVKESEVSYQWIVNKVAPKLIKWMESVEEGKSYDGRSLRLVNVTEYSTLYNKLKESYGKRLVEMWPETTDPLKFVYEDIGIATYLLLLWKNKPKQRFVDLGCGNGLLVHILNSEGHLGVGFDLRARKIWSMYPPSTKLEVRAIIPSSDSLFPDVDWLIGNHSDELTVWIPVMASRSSYTCNFFLLPCCPYEFDGKKYCRTNTSVSQYSDFLGYVQTVCTECGFNTEKDKLRIPSTKRTCFVGQVRMYPESEMEENIQKLISFVNSKCYTQNDDKNITSGSSWCPEFKPRMEERVRNCTQIQSDIRESIVNLVAEQLLIKRRTSDEGWNYGGIVEVGTLAKIIPKETLKKLKNECGGLQTLLKNHHYIFKIQQGKVEFRVPTEKCKTDTNIWKKKPCWFFYNHPHSCPLANEKCSFIHNS